MGQLLGRKLTWPYTQGACLYVCGRWLFPRSLSEDRNGSRRASTCAAKMETLCVGVWPPEVASRSGAAAPARPAGNRREMLKGSNRQRAGGTGPLGTRSLKAGISVFPAAGRSATRRLWHRLKRGYLVLSHRPPICTMGWTYAGGRRDLSPAWRMEAASPKKTQLLTGELALLIHYQMVSSIREKPDLDLMGRKMDLDHKPQPRKKKKVNNSSHH
ncbi:uncharacterized protein [Tursiops truncatus]|uniref:uncharacterized protein isoform X2 n=1 Tax=Tursiops truncatus TaxID=9739 RepID=UPI003CCF6EF4